MQFLFQENGLGDKLLRENPDRYIYEAVRKGVDITLPEAISIGINDVTKRENWNQPAESDYALPTETWREHIARRTRCLDLRQRLTSGEINSINDFITYNLDIRQLAQDVIENCYDPELIWAFYQAISEIKILDPTCGSGAFLFAALNILEPLYEACLERMQIFLDEDFAAIDQNNAEILDHFRQIIEQADCHPNRRYFILKSITINNLYGVDIMEEATEICKLRLFLKLVAQLEPDVSKPNLDIEPLPDIDFNIRAGNTLVGFTSLDEVRNAIDREINGQKKLVYNHSIIEEIEQQASMTERTFQEFLNLQNSDKVNGKQSSIKKAKLRKNLNKLNERLDCYLADEYEQDQSKRPAKFKKWKESHQPFHWFVEFYGIIKRGGFDVIIGNPPYIEYSKIRDYYKIVDSFYYSQKATNLFAYVIERSILLMSKKSKLGLIIPISFVCTQRMKYIQDVVFNNLSCINWHSFYAERPSKLFEGAEVLLTISIISKISNLNYFNKKYTTGLRKWYSESRQHLFNTIHLNYVDKRINEYIVPKISDAIENSILSKIITKSTIKLGSFFVKNSSNLIYYRIGGGRYWKIFTTFQPVFLSNGKLSVSSREKKLYFNTSEQRDIVVSALSSSLFFWYFILTTNSRDLNPSDLKNFPLDINSMSSKNKNKLINLSGILMDDYHNNKQQKEKTSVKTGHIIYEEFYPRLSKHIIDKIDCVLSQHYGFTDEELDFIINYDIKYRMGQN